MYMVRSFHRNNQDNLVPVDINPSLPEFSWCISDNQSDVSKMKHWRTGVFSQWIKFGGTVHMATVMYTDCTWPLYCIKTAHDHCIV